MIKNISSLEQLEEEKEKLKHSMTISKSAFSKSLETNKKELQSFLLKKATLSAGVIGLSNLIFKKIKKPNNKAQLDTHDATNTLKKLLFPFALKMLQQYLQKSNSANKD